MKKIIQRLLVGSALDPRRPAVHAGPPHTAYPLKPGPMRALTLLFATGFGTGLSPFAPGTTGCVPALLLFWFMAPPYGSWPAYIVATALFIALGIVTASAAEGFFGKRDDGRIVIDEIAGMMVALLGAPRTWQAVLLGFLLFRFFDIVKLAPAYRAQALRGGWGIVLDDVVSGAYACVALHVLLALGRLIF